MHAIGEMGTGKMGIGKRGIGEIGIGELGIGEMGWNRNNPKILVIILAVFLICYCSGDLCTRVHCTRSMNTYNIE